MDVLGNTLEDYCWSHNRGPTTVVFGDWHLTPGIDGFWFDDSSRWYGFLEGELQTFVSTLRALGIVARGVFTWSGEEDEDIGMVLIRQGQVCHSYATIIYHSELIEGKIRDRARQLRKEAAAWA